MHHRSSVFHKSFLSPHCDNVAQCDTGYVQACKNNGNFFCGGCIEAMAVLVCFHDYLKCASEAFSKAYLKLLT